MNQSTLQKIQAVSQQQELDRRSSNLAAALVSALQINPHGKELIEVIGEHTNSNNFLAVKSWVLDQLRDNALKPEEDRPLCFSLRDNLQQVLTEWHYC